MSSSCSNEKATRAKTHAFGRKAHTIKCTAKRAAHAGLEKSTHRGAHVKGERTALVFLNAMKTARLRQHVATSAMGLLAPEQE